MSHPLHIPYTTSIQPRPIMRRVLARLGGEEVPPPSDDEKSDAIKILREGPSSQLGIPDSLFIEAQRVLDEASS